MTDSDASATGKQDGGPAFPYPDYNAPDVGKGMSLRDWFAGMALQGLCATNDYDTLASARISYALSDAMLAERAKP